MRAEIGWLYGFWLAGVWFALSFLDTFSSKTSNGFLNDCATTALELGVDVHKVNLSEFEPIEEAFNSNPQMIDALTGCVRKTLVIFDLVDKLAHSEESLVSWLRSVVFTRKDAHLVCIFSGRNESLRAIFEDYSALFYKSNLTVFRFFFQRLTVRARSKTVIKIIEFIFMFFSFFMFFTVSLLLLALGIALVSK